MWKKIKQIYKEALRSSIDEPEPKKFFQLWYIGLLIAQIAILCKVESPNVGVYTIIIIMHLISIYILGYQKYEQQRIKTIKREDFNYCYMVANVILFVVTIFITKNLTYAIIIFVATFGFFAIFAIAAVILQMINIINNDDEYIFIHKKLYSFVLYAVIFIPVILSINYVRAGLLIKVLVILGYIILSPIIVWCSDRGMNFFDFFDVFE